MKKSFLLLCTLLLVLGCALPLAAYHLTRAVLGPAVSTVRLPLSSPESTASTPEISAAYAGEADRFLIQDASTGQVLELSRRVLPLFCCRRNRMVQFSFPVRLFLLY